jgi:hypothetical protein
LARLLPLQQNYTSFAQVRLFLKTEAAWTLVIAGKHPKRDASASGAQLYQTAEIQSWKPVRVQEQAEKLRGGERLLLDSPRMVTAAAASNWKPAG